MIVSPGFSDHLFLHHNGPLFPSCHLLDLQQVSQGLQPRAGAECFKHVSFILTKTHFTDDKALDGGYSLTRLVSAGAEIQFGPLNFKGPITG